VEDTRKHLTGLFIAPPVGELRIDDRILDRGMAHPILDKAQVRPRVQEMGRNRVLEHVKMPLGGWNVRKLAIVFHQRIELPAGDRDALLREKEAR
jgi:hypothetical protein